MFISLLGDNWDKIKFKKKTDLFSYDVSNYFNLEIRPRKERRKMAISGTVLENVNQHPEHILSAPLCKTEICSGHE